jgi:uncharacterized protein
MTHDASPPTAGTPFAKAGPTPRIDGPTATHPGRGWDTRPLIAFFVLAYGWTWGLGAVSYALMQRGAIPDPAVGVLETAVGFGPVLAALVVTATQGRRALVELLAQLVRWRVSPVWYLVAVYGPALVAVAGAMVWYGPAALAYDRIWPAIITRYLPFALMTLVTAGPIQEELGWRGFALPRLQRRLGAAAGTAVLGGLWAFWHLPNVLFRGWDAPMTGWFLLATFLTAFAYTWLVNGARGSVLLAMLLHASINTSTRLVSTLVPDAALPTIEAASHGILALAYGVVAIVLLAVTRGRLLAPHPERALG